MRTDFENIEEGAYVTLHPRADNPLHKKPIKAMYADGYFYCDGSDHTQGPDYYWRDVSQFNEGYSP